MKKTLIAILLLVSLNVNAQGAGEVAQSGSVAGQATGPVAPPQQTGQWVTSGQQMQAAFPPSSYGPQSYPIAPVGGQGQPHYSTAPGTSGAMDDGTRGLFPPKNPLEVARDQYFPLTPDEIRSTRAMYEESREAKAYQPLRAMPRISSISVDLSPGASMPVARVLPGTPGTLLFIDSTGAPWPLMAAPIISDNRKFTSEWLKDTHVLVISSLSPFEVGTVTVFLAGLATPVVVQLVSGEEGTQEAVRVTDVRLDLRVPGRGPNAKAPVLGPGKIELHDDTLQAVLDGVGVAGAKSLKLVGNVPAGTEVYQLDQQLYVRTTYDIKSPFDQTLSSANGTRVYRMPLTPYLTFSDMGRSVTVQIELL